MISFDQFNEIKLCVGTVVKAEPFPEARKPALKVWVDFGPEWGIKKTSAQITVHYTPESLVGRQVVGLVNIPPRQIGRFISEFLLTGFVDEDGAVVLAVPEKPVKVGSHLH
jgi:tRNA-binding protein